jgi:hypothetical protein
MPVHSMKISSQKPRRKPKEGDRKTVKGVDYIRQQVLTRDGYHVRNGRPVFEWVRYENSRAGRAAQTFGFQPGLHHVLWGPPGIGKSLVSASVIFPGWKP